MSRKKSCSAIGWWSFLFLVAVGMLASAQAQHGDHAAWITSARSGDWSAVATWQGGKLPAAGARVHILPGHVVRYDVNSDQGLRAVYVAGTLSFARDKDTRLDVGVLKIEAGTKPSENGFDCDTHSEPDGHGGAKHGATRAALEVGSQNDPIPPGKTAKIRLVAFEGQDKQSCPAILCCGGRMDFHGAPLSRTWVKLGANADVGATEVTLEEAVRGWRVGDQIVLTPTSNNYRKETPTERRVITAIDGTKVKFDAPLEVAHLGEGEFRGEVANLSRNVVVESAAPEGERGHTMYHVGSAGGISYAEFRHLGKKNVLGRYSLHFHLIGNSMRGSSVIGASIWDSHNRWLTIHGTNYLVVRDCVGYGSVGHGFFLEDGTEIYNVLDRNLAIEARAGKKLPKQVLPFDQNEGAGYWWANSLNTFTRNVAAGCDLYGFRFEATQTSERKLQFPVMQPDGSMQTVDIRTLPFVRFDDNEVHSSYGLYGINLGEGVNRVGPDNKHPFVVRNTKIWNVHYGFRPQVPSLLIENMKIHSAAYGVYHPNFDNHVYRNLTIQRTNAEPFNRGHDDVSVQHGSVTVDGLTFDSIRAGGMPLIQISDDNATGQARTVMRGVKVENWIDGSRQKAIVNLGGGTRPTPKTEKGVPVVLLDWFGPGRHAQVVSIRSPEYKANPDKYRAEPPLTGDESRVAEISDASFPELLSPIDDLPPTTVITHVERTGSSLRVRGTSADNGAIKQVQVNETSVRATAANFAEWEIELPITGHATKLVAKSTDAAGNVEKLPHVLTLND